MDNNPQHANRRALRSAGQLPVDPEAQLNTQLAGQDTLGKGEITRAEPQNKKQNLKKKKVRTLMRVSDRVSPKH